MVDLLALGAHPDDIEFGCGGILAKEAARGKSIVMVDLTIGEKGTNGTPQIRKEEGEAAAKLIGAKRIVLDFADCEVIDSYANRLKLVKLFREQRPRLILAPQWKGEQTHPDHLACGLMARYACRYARFSKILPEIPIFQPDGILHYTNPIFGAPEFLVDVSDYVEVWKQMMLAHASQMKTYNYREAVLKAAEGFGILINRPYAQGLTAGNPVIIDDLMAISRGTREI